MTIHDVTFPSAGIPIAGHLHLTDGDARPRAAVVVGHPASGVKEQAADVYATQLASAGFIALTFDAAFQGESGGDPRGLEDPAHRIEDLKSAVSYLTTRPEVDPDRIGGFGICASGGYIIPAAAGDHRIRAVATVSAADIGRQFRVGADGGQDPAIIAGMLDAAATARSAQAAGSPTGMFPIFPATEADARAGGTHVFEGWQYYCTDRAQHPRSAKELALESIDRIATFDPFKFIGLLTPRPLLMIAGTAAVTAWMTQHAFEHATGPKRLHWVDGATHVSLYDHDVPRVAPQLVSFFADNLN